MRLLLNSVFSAPGAKFITIDKKHTENRDERKTTHDHASRVNTRRNNYATKITWKKSHRKSIHAHEQRHVQPQKGWNTTALKPYGYTLSKHTPRLWKHEAIKNMFSLVVEDFRVKNFSKKC